LNAVRAEVAAREREYSNLLNELQEKNNQITASTYESAQAQEAAYSEYINNVISAYGNLVTSISSVNSQLTNTEQLVDDPNGDFSAGSATLPSPAEDGSYGTNGDAVFGFTPEDIYIEHNMHYIVSTVPLSFNKPVNRLTVVNVKTAAELKAMMDRIR
jgi:hypothetical protein